MKETLRLALARSVALTLRLHSRPYVPPVGPLLVVAPHPDDETLGCGGAISAHCRLGRRVHVIFLTDGEASHPGQLDLGARRRAEALAALAVLAEPAPPPGAEFLAASDGQLDRLPAPVHAAVIDALAATLRTLAPAAVFVPYARGGSSEHTAATALAHAAALAAGTSGRAAAWLEYPIWAWWDARRLAPRLRPAAENLRHRLAPPDLARKRRALAAHATQVLPLSPGSAPALPAAISAACLGADEFYFRSSPAAPAPTLLPP